MKQADNQRMQRLWESRERKWLREAASRMGGDRMIKEPILLLSAGHGFEDPGALGNDHAQEKDINVALAWATIAAWNTIWDDPVGRVVPVEGLTLGRVIKLVNSYHAHFKNMGIPVWALEIHCNSSVNSTVRGAEALHYPNNSLSKAVGNILLKHVCGPSWPNRGAKTPTDVGRGKLGFIDDTTMPALILEVGFITNPEDFAVLTGPGMLTKATQIAAAIQEAQLYVQAWAEGNLSDAAQRRP